MFLTCFYNVFISFSEICSFPNNWTGKWFHLGFPGVNFINILCAPFSYKSALLSFSLVTVWLYKKFGAKILAQKRLVKCWWNWPQNPWQSGLVASQARELVSKCPKICSSWKKGKNEIILNLNNNTVFPHYPVFAISTKYIVSNQFAHLRPTYINYNDVPQLKYIIWMGYLWCL